MALYPTPSHQPSGRRLVSRVIHGLTPTEAAGITSHGGLHHIMQGMGDFGVAVVPQTLHTIEVGVAA